jgi:lambda family phage portal protein
VIAPVVKNRILDEFGRPVAGKKATPQIQALQRPKRPVEATYDAARDTTDMQNYWANADAYDADSANSKAVRAKLVQRARYEVANNGYADGIVQTHANYVMGTGPSLRMRTRNKNLNAMIEAAWQQWTKAVQLRRKLWCMTHAKVQDGETFGLLRNNPRLRSPVDLDLILIETEQVTSPRIIPYAVGYIDGIRYDEFGNPISYDVLKYHPGGQFAWSGTEFEQIPAKWMLHWFMLRRPGQHRGVPEFRSTLNVGASSRRWREATLAAAETAADYAAIIHTNLTPDGADQVSPLTTVDFDKRMMTALPMGWDVQQMKAEHPGATYEAFHAAQVNEMARPKSIPQNLAMCNSSGYNFASGKLDHGTYFLTIDLERADCEDTVLDPLFDRWFERAILAYGWGFDATLAARHSWDWPHHPIGDPESEANAVDKRLKNGSTTLSQVYAEQGLDFEDHIAEMATDYGLSVDQMRETLRMNQFAIVTQNMANINTATEPDIDDDIDDVEEQEDVQAAVKVDLRPTAGMAAAAKTGLRLHKEGRSGKGLKPETVARAGKISRREVLTEDHVREMAAWFARHDKASRSPGWNTKGKEKPGWVAWSLWGGDAAKSWSQAKVRQMDGGE